MGLLDKVKNILFDEEEVEIPVIKKEPKKEKKYEEVNVSKVEEQDPIRELKVPKEDFSDKNNYKSESTFTFPIDFEDEEPIKKVEKPKPKVEEYKPIKTHEKKDYSSYLSKHEDKKKFKPTPIISPVYGVLDQNYKKEDVIVKKDVLRRPNELSLDEVRKKAFGTLEDEIDANLVTDSDIDVIKTKEEVKIKKEQIIEKKKDVEVEKPVDKLKTIGELIEEDSMNIDIPELDSIKINSLDDNINSTTEELEEPKNSIDDLLDREEEIFEDNKDDIESNEIDEEEEDLFSLIDSMYEEKGE